MRTENTVDEAVMGGADMESTIDGHMASSSVSAGCDADDVTYNRTCSVPSMKINEILKILEPGVISKNGHMLYLLHKDSGMTGIDFLASVYSSRDFRDNSELAATANLSDRYEWMRGNVKSYYEAIMKGNKSETLGAMFDTEMYIIDMIESVKTEFNLAKQANDESKRITDERLRVQDMIDSGDLPFRYRRTPYQTVRDMAYGKSKSKTLDIILDLDSRKIDAEKKLRKMLGKMNVPDLEHGPAYIFVIGFDFDQDVHVGMMNTFGKVLPEPLDMYSSEGKELVRKIAYEDEAILIDSSRHILATNANLKNDSIPYLIKRNMDLFGYTHSDEMKDLDKIGFFDPKVSTRNNNSLAASYCMPNTIIYTFSEETGNIRRMENGLISLSTYNNESVLVRLIESYLPQILMSKAYCREH